MSWQEYYGIQSSDDLPEDWVPKPLHERNPLIRDQIYFILLCTNFSKRLPDWIETRIIDTNYGEGKGDNKTLIINHLNQLSQILSDPTDWAISQSDLKTILNQLIFQWTHRDCIYTGLDNLNNSNNSNNSKNTDFILEYNPLLTHLLIDNLTSFEKVWNYWKTAFQKFDELFKQMEPLKEPDGLNKGCFINWWPYFHLDELGKEMFIRIQYKKDNKIITQKWKWDSFE
jgi:hypothetical protein